jgi:hypothetical protein
MAIPTLIGLCAECRHAKIIQSAKGSVFIMCEQAKIDPRFNKYPMLPVLRCSGFKSVLPEETVSDPPEPH